MKKFMINICYGSNERSSESDDIDFVMKKYGEWSEQLKDHTVAAHKLKDGEGRRLILSNNEMIDGPYVESKESIGGYYIVKAKNYDDAVELAKGCPTIHYQGGYVDVREIEFVDRS